MELMITGTNIEITPEVRNYVEKKMGKLPRYLNSIMECKVEISEENTKAPEQRYLVRSTVTGIGVVLHSEERGKDPFMAIDKTSAIMTRQIEDHKGKLYDKGRGSSLARGKFTTGEAPAPELSKVVETRRLPAETMTIAESIEHLEQADLDYHFFVDADTSSLKLLYRRKDGNFGVIEPQF